MATRLYFRSSTSAVGPTAKASSDTDYFGSVPSDKNTPKEMTLAKGAAQTSSTGNYNNGGSNRMTLYRIWVSPALAAQTLTGGQANYYLAAGYKESSGNMNMALRWFVYVWRSGSGKVKDIISNGSGAGVSATEHSTSEVECVYTGTGQAGDYSIQTGDRIVVEAWFDLPNTKSAAYDATAYYEGTDDTMVDGTATSDAGAYFECPQTLLIPQTVTRALNYIYSLRKKIYANLTGTIEGFETYNIGDTSITGWTPIAANHYIVNTPVAEGSRALRIYPSGTGQWTGSTTHTLNNPLTASSPGTYTFRYWVRHTDLANDYCTMYLKTSGGNIQFYSSMGHTDGFRAWNSSTPVTVLASVSSDTWYGVLVVLNPSAGTWACAVSAGAMPTVTTHNGSFFQSIVTSIDQFQYGSEFQDYYYLDSFEEAGGGEHSRWFLYSILGVTTVTRRFGSLYHIGGKITKTWGSFYHLSKYGRRWYPQGGNINVISGRPADKHGFSIAHTTNIVQCNKTVDGQVRKYLAYDSDAAGSNIYLYYSETIEGPWTPYTSNPILSGSTQFRTPSVVYTGGTFHMFLNNKSAATLRRYTSTDGIAFSYVETVISHNNSTDNACVWLNPNDGLWYLVWFDNPTSVAGVGGFNYIKIRSASSPTGFAGQTDSIIRRDVDAYPTIFYREGLYWLITEYWNTSTSKWCCHAFVSPTINGYYIPCYNSPILTNDEACPVFNCSEDGTHLYLFNNIQTASIWYADWRNAKPNYVNEGATDAESNNWTSYANAYGDSNNAIYATATPAQNSTVDGIWKTYGLTFPDLATIVGVEVIPTFKLSTAASITELKVAVSWDGGSSWSTDDYKHKIQNTPTSDTEFVIDFTDATSWTTAKLNDSNFRVKVIAVRGNSATSATFSLDSVLTRILYTAPIIKKTGHLYNVRSLVSRVGRHLYSILSAGAENPIIRNPTAEGTNAWTTPNEGRTSNNNYATAAPAKNNSVSGVWTTFGITDPGGGVTVKKVELGVEFFVSTQGSIATISTDISWNAGSNWGTHLWLETDTEINTSDPNAYTWIDVTNDTTWDWTKLNNSNLQVRIVANRGNSSTAVTFSLDAIAVKVTYVTLVTRAIAHLYNLKNFVSKANRHLYNLRGFISKLNRQLYNIRTKITRKSGHLYTLRNFVSKTNRQLYTIRNFVSKTNRQLYSVRNFVSRKSAQLYNVRNFVSRVNRQLYSIRTLVKRTKGFLYNIRAGVGRTLTGMWSILGLTKVTREFIAKYNVRNFASRTNRQLYNLKNFAVRKTTQIYNLRNFVSKKTTQLYNIRGFVSRINRQLYTIRGFVSKVNRQLYTIRGFVSRVNRQLYHVRGFISRKTTQLYNIRGFVSRKSTQIYNMAGIAKRVLIAIYHVRTKISKKSTQMYSIRGFVSRVNRQLYNVRGFISRKLAGLYNIRNIIARTNIQLYRIRGFISRKSTQLYNIRNFVSRKSAYLYNIRTSISRAWTGRYTIRNFVSRTNRQLYNMAGLLVRVLKSIYHIRTSVSRKSAQIYSIRGFISRINRQLYTIRGFVSKTNRQSYNIKNFVTSVRRGLYNIRGFVSRTKGFTYNIRKSVARTVTGIYTILSAVAVQRVLGSLYNIRTRITRKEGAMYNLRNFVSRKSGQLYNIRSFVSRVNRQKYTIRGFVSRSYTTIYNMSGKCVRALTGIYHIRTKITTSRKAVYNIRTLITRTRGTLYTIRNFATRTRTSIYNIRNFVSRKATATYNIRNLITKTRSSLYNIRKSVASARGFIYNIRSRLSRTFTASYQIRTSISKVRTFVYSISPVVRITAVKGFLYRIFGVEGLLADPYNRLMNEMYDYVVTKTAAGQPLENFYIYKRKPRNRPLFFPCVTIDMDRGTSDAMFGKEYSETVVVNFQMLFKRDYAQSVILGSRQVILMKEALARYYRNVLLEVVNGFESSSLKLMDVNVTGMTYVPMKRGQTLYGATVTMQFRFKSGDDWEDT